MIGTSLAAADANDFWIYDTAAGKLYYDSNANAAGGVATVASFQTTGGAPTDVGLASSDITFF